MNDPRTILARHATEAAPQILGWQLVGPGVEARIVETEAYTCDDPGCHAFRGPTPRNRAMFERPGLAYVYFTYGNHWMLNVVAEPEGQGAAVLIRAAEPIAGLELMRSRRAKARRDEDLLSGPGKLAQAFGIDGKIYALDLLDPESAFRIEPAPPPKSTLVGTRIGLAEGRGDDLPWRYVDGAAKRWVSKPWPRS